MSCDEEHYHRSNYTKYYNSFSFNIAIFYIRNRFSFHCHHMNQSGRCVKKNERNTSLDDHLFCLPLGILYSKIYLSCVCIAYMYSFSSARWIYYPINKTKQKKNKQLGIFSKGIANLFLTCLAIYQTRLSSKRSGKRNENANFFPLNTLHSINVDVFRSVQVWTHISNFRFEFVTTVSFWVFATKNRSNTSYSFLTHSLYNRNHFVMRLSHRLSLITLKMYVSVLLFFFHLTASNICTYMSSEARKYYYYYTELHRLSVLWSFYCYVSHWRRISW